MRKSLAVVSVSLLALAAPALTPPPMPQPGPEHEMLKNGVGIWDATVETFMQFGAAAFVSKGTETVTMMGGFWQLSEFKSEMMGQPFEGCGATSYDPMKRKYVGLGRLMARLLHLEAPTTRRHTLTGTQEVPTDGAIKIMRRRWKDADTRVFTMYAPDGKTVGMHHVQRE
jgi:hypothetical protein